MIDEPARLVPDRHAAGAWKHGLGRGLERFDRPTVKAISKRIAATDYRFSDLVLEIVNSLPFEMSRKGDRT